MWMFFVRELFALYIPDAGTDEDVYSSTALMCASFQHVYNTCLAEFGGAPDDVMFRSTDA